MECIGILPPPAPRPVGGDPISDMLEDVRKGVVVPDKEETGELDGAGGALSGSL